VEIFIANPVQFRTHITASGHCTSSGACPQCSYQVVPASFFGHPHAISVGVPNMRKAVNFRADLCAVVTKHLHLVSDKSANGETPGASNSVITI